MDKKRIAPAEKLGGRFVKNKPAGDGRGNLSEWYGPPLPKPAPFLGPREQQIAEESREHATALKRLEDAVDARHFSRSVCFEAARSTNGNLRAGVWDRVGIFGSDVKDGQATEFTFETFSQMLRNFAARGDQIALDANHSSGRPGPAPALGFYGALAIVMNGRIVRMATARGVAADGSEPGIDLSRDGLWALRTDNTPLGEELLPNYKFVSPMFMPDGTDRDGRSIGYTLLAVAATNTPHLPQTQLTI